VVKDDVFSLTAGKRFVATGKMLSGEAPPTIGSVSGGNQPTCGNYENSDMNHQI
jgi:hypothetical protein